MKRRWILIAFVFMALLLFLAASLAQAQKPLPPPSRIQATNPLDCVDDELEENDDLATALAIWDEWYPFLTICSGDDDWFAIDAMTGVTITVVIYFTHADGDLDLYIYDSDLIQVANSTTYSDDEEITYTSSATGTYYIRVNGYEGAENIYELIVDGSCDHCRFSYQGQLQVEEAPANGQYEFQFAIYDPYGNLRRGPVDKTLNVVDGLFSTDLYLGDPLYFPSYLEIKVRAVGEPTWVTLAPRQRMDTVPYARTLQHDNSEGDGVVVDHAGDDGVYVADAGDDGVYVAGAGYYGVYANTTRTGGDYGLYTPDKIYGSNLTTSSLSLIAQVAGNQALNSGDVVSIIGLANPLQGSVQRLPQVFLAEEKTSDNVVGVVESAMVLVPKPQRGNEDAEEEVLQLKLADGPAQPGDYIAMTVLGVAEVKIDPDSKVNIRAGQRLTTSQLGGHARNLRTETLNDMVVAEGAPVLGIALADPEPGSDTIPVFVTLR